MEGAANIKDFRPIKLDGCIYKLREKVIARRIAKVMDKVVGECRYTFVEGRHIMCAVLE